MSNISGCPRDSRVIVDPRETPWEFFPDAMIEVAQHPEGFVLPVRAQPGARKAGILGEQGGALKVAVTAPADRGRANQALIEAFRDLLDLKRSQVELLSGATSRNKRFLIRGLSKTELERRLANILMRT